MDRCFPVLDGATWSLQYSLSSCEQFSSCTNLNLPFVVACFSCIKACNAGLGHTHEGVLCTEYSHLAIHEHLSPESSLVHILKCQKRDGKIRSNQDCLNIPSFVVCPLMLPFCRGARELN